MRVALLAVLTVTGCAGGGLAAPGACRYAFTAPAASAGESQRCTLGDDGRLVFSFDDTLGLTVADGAADGRARLEARDSLRASLGFPGERFGLVTVDYAGHECAQWAGHVFWSVTADAWHVETVGTSGCDGFTFAASFDSP